MLMCICCATESRGPRDLKDPGRGLDGREMFEKQKNSADTDNAIRRFRMRNRVVVRPRGLGGKRGLPFWKCRPSPSV